MSSFLQRTEALIGAQGIAKLSRAHVAVFGLGGVGGYVTEALARSGIGALDLIDHDTFSLSNLNRQILATHATIGRQKTDVAKERIEQINPACKVTTFPVFFLPETADSFRFEQYDCVIDAIDTVSAKIELAVRCKRAGTPLISSMGTGNKMDPSRLQLCDISKTHTDPLARVMRTELRKRGITHLLVVFSDEPPMTPHFENEETEADPATEPNVKKSVPGSTAFVPSAAGLLLASAAVRGILNGF
ncbi:MAG: tRNA threonylcarbamoyladenosine dehydratase [Clostridia bacterium]|nr:tRNA threonylcarbamoyladenosine dehydratase [Clostridia bacterium]